MNLRHQSFPALLALAAAFSVVLPGGAVPPPRPNLILILADDLRWDEMDYPFVRAPNVQRLAREGARFTNAFVTTPLCSPSRASFLTGQYAHKHGITDNTDHSPRSHELVTFLRLLHDAGYETAFFGKWHMGVDDSARPGIDRWISVEGQGSYLDPVFNVDGEREKRSGYFTDLLNQFAVEFLRRERTKPFLLVLSHKAVHPDITQYADGSISDPRGGKFIPAERHKRLYTEARIPRRRSYGKVPEGKPALLRPIGQLPPLGPESVTDDETIRNRLRMLAAVDEGLGEILQTLEAQQQLDNTVVIFTSDEGYFYGEHGLSAERRLAYEESARIPLLVRYPKLIRAGRSIDQFALGIDLAPTLLELGGAPVPKDMQGRSLVPWLRGQKVPWRNSFLIEYFSDKVFPRVTNMGYQCVRTERWKYIHYAHLDGMDELYDLKTDPFEMKNLIGKPHARPALEEMRAELDRLLQERK
jgi:N-acetylglucosamine-6-sulfatase